ncbi:class I SAM-dependent methyltransferase, partial [archaeon]
MGRVAASAAPASASAATRAAPAAKSAKTTHECTPAPGSSLLPSDISDFRRREYWASFFDKCGGKAFEWYGSWKHFEGNVDAALAGVAPREACDMAVIGCGNSDMSRAAWSAGYKRITNMDYEPGVIARMQVATAKSCPGMKWMVQDASAMCDVDSASFHAVLDKGTLDAMTPDEGVDTTAGVVAMFGEVARILRPGGKYMIITLAQDHVARTLLQHATSTAADAWSAIDVATFAQPDMSSAACQFFITLTRAGDSGAGTASSTADAASSGRGAVRVHVPLTFEVTDNEEAAAKSATRRKRGKGGAHAAGVSSRLPVDTLCFPTTAPNCVSATLDAVHDIQWSFSTFQTLSSIAPGHYERVDVWCLPGRTPIITPAGAKSPFATGTAAGADTDVFHSVPRFSITVVDGSLAPSAGVLLVPQGREHEWSFSNVEGQNKLLKSVPYGRLLFVCMNRGHTFASQKAVQEELSPIVVMLVPPHVRAGASMPFLAVASDIGRREIVARGSTACSGDYVIEDVEEE